MSNFIKQYQNIFVIIGLVVIAFVGYSFFVTGDSDNPLVVQDIDQSQTAVEQELLSLLLELRSIQLNTRLFSDERFQSLQDFNQDIVSEPVGRSNPFAPLGQ